MLVVLLHVSPAAPAKFAGVLQLCFAALLRWQIPSFAKFCARDAHEGALRDITGDAWNDAGNERGRERDRETERRL